MSVRSRTRSGRPVVIPAPQESDFEDVHWALSAATTLWERGEDSEALKWLRRAASAAADRDADVRAVELFKAAADVAGVVDAREEIRNAQALSHEGGPIPLVNRAATHPAGQQPAHLATRGAPHPGPAGDVNAGQPPGGPQPGRPQPGGQPPGRPQPGGPPPGRPQPGGQPPGRPQPGGQPPGRPQPGGQPPGRPQPGGQPPGGPQPGGPQPGGHRGQPNPRPGQTSRPRAHRHVPGQTGPPPPARTGPPPPAHAAANPRHTQTGPPTHLKREDPPTKRRSTEPRDLVPPVPPEPTLSERFAGLSYQETEEDTFIRPETMLRRALMAIDPTYADRTEIDSDGDDEDDSEPGFARPPFRDSRPYHEGGEDEDTERRSKVDLDADLDDPNDETTRQRLGDLVAAARSRPPADTDDDDEDDTQEPPASEPAPRPTESARGTVPGIAAFRVAVLPIPEERDVRLIFIPPGTDPPPGVAVALLVPPSEEDARLINAIYNDTDAKF